MGSNATIEWSAETSKKALPVLAKLIKRQLGVGAYGKLEKALGQPAEWWQMQKKLKKGITFSTLLAVLKAIGVSLAEFEAELFAGEEETLESEDPESAAAFPPILQLIATGEQESGRNWQQYLRRLDEQRYVKPFESLRQLTESSPYVPPEYVASALAVAGACYRSLYSMRDAKACLHSALKDVVSSDQSADIYQRLIYCYKPTDKRRALYYYEEALKIFCRLSNREKISELQVDNMLIHYAAADFSTTISLSREIYERHLSFLDYRNIFTVCQSLAVSLFHLGERDESADWLQRAGSALEGRRPPANLEAHFHWTAGNILRSPSRLLRAIRTFGAEHSFDGASCGLDLCSLALESGETELFQQTVELVISNCGPAGQTALQAVFENLKGSLLLNRAIDIAATKKVLARKKERASRSLLKNIAL